jgi:DNA-binding beta-propeller fold protein YncE
MILTIALGTLFLVSVVPTFVFADTSASANFPHVVTNIPIGVQSIYIITGPLVYDSANGYIYVIVTSSMCSGSFCNYVAVVNGATNKVVTKLTIVSANQNLNSILFDPANSEVYVLSDNAQSVSFLTSIKGASILSTVQEASRLSNLLYDPVSKNLIADGKNSIFVIDSTTNKIIKTVAVGTDGVATVGFDPSNKVLYVVTADSNNPFPVKTYVINAKTYKIIATRAWPYSGACFGWFTFDPLNKDMYYGDFCAGLFVINSTTSKPVKQIGHAYPFGVGSDLVYNPASKEIYFWNGYSIPNGGTIEITDAATNTLKGSVGSIEGDALTYDATNNAVYVVGAGTLNVISPQDVVVKSITLGNSIFLLSLVYDPGNSNVYIPNGGDLTVVSS